MPGFNYQSLRAMTCMADSCRMPNGTGGRGRYSHACPLSRLSEVEWSQLQVHLSKEGDGPFPAGRSLVVDGKSSKVI